MAKADGWAIAKAAPTDFHALEYANHDRACQVYSHWMSGFTEDEIALFFGLPLEEVAKDLQHIKVTLPTRTIIQHNNDRTRILLQREESESFRKLLKDTLATRVEQFLAAGISPTNILKEFREATGMTQRPEPLVQFNQANIFGGGKPEPAQKAVFTSPEDIIRMVLREQQAQIDATVEAEAAEVEGAETEAIPDDDD